MEIRRFFGVVGIVLVLLGFLAIATATLKQGTSLDLEKAAFEVIVVAAWLAFQAITFGTMVWNKRLWWANLVYLSFYAILAATLDFGTGRWDFSPLALLMYWLWLLVCPLIALTDLFCQGFARARRAL